MTNRKRNVSKEMKFEKARLVLKAYKEGDITLKEAAAIYGISIATADKLIREMKNENILNPDGTLNSQFLRNGATQGVASTG